jgi:two-component system cell cycle sensor histidine kinase/response regulator CckA
MSIPTAVPPETMILLAEDEQSVRDLVDRILKNQGYAVLVAADGRQALEMAAAYPGPLHLLLTDLRMPDLDGASLARKLRNERPEIKVMLMSAYFDETLRAFEGWTFVRKPFQVSALIQAVRDALTQPLKPLEDVPELTRWLGTSSR